MESLMTTFVHFSSAIYIFFISGREALHQALLRYEIVLKFSHFLRFYSLSSLAICEVTLTFSL